MASLFWVGGSTAYDGVTNRLATTSGGTATVAAIAAGDTVTFDANSPAAAVVTTSAAISCTTLTLNTGFTGSLTMSNALTVSGTITLTQGTLDTNGQTVSCGNFSTAGSLTRTLTLDTSTVTCSGTTGWSCGVTTNMTTSAASSTITLTGIGGNFFHASSGGNGGVYGTVNINGAGTCTFNLSGGGSSIANLSRTGTNSKTDILSVSGSYTVTGTLMLGGNTIQGVNRLLVQSGTVGNQRTFTLTGAAVVISGDVDFQDIAMSGSPSWTNAGSAYVGDAGGNGTLITTNITTPATQTRTGAGGNWDAANWTSRMPLPQDGVVVSSGASGTISTNSTPRLGGNIDFTGFAGTFSTTGANTALYGNLTLASGMTVSGTQTLTLSGRGVYTLTSAGKSFSQAITISAPTGTYTLQDALTVGGNLALTLSDGTLVDNGKAVTFGSWTSNSNRTRALTHSGAWSLTATGSGTIWNQTSTAMTLTSTGSITITNASGNSRTFSTGSLPYGDLIYTVPNSTGTLAFTNGATTSYRSLIIGAGRTVTWNTGVTPAVRDYFNVSGVNWGYEYLPGVTGNYVSTPDAAPLRITSDIDLRVRVAADTWVPAARADLVAKWNDTGNQRSYLFSIETTGKLALWLSTNGTATQSVSSTVVTGFAAGSLQWVRATWRQSDGRVQFFTANGALTNPSGADWTQLGANVTISIVSVPSIAVTTALVEVGTQTTGTINLAAGKFYKADIRNNINDDGTGIQLSADFTTKTFGANSFTESSANAATVTINGTAGQAGDGRIAFMSATNGVSATITKTSPNFVQTANYLVIQDITATPSTLTWYVGANSVNSSNNSGLIFTAAPAIRNYPAPDYVRSTSGTRTVAGARTLAGTRTVI